MVENDLGRSDVPAVLNGAWWGLGGGNSAQVFISNTSDSAQMAQVYLDFAGKRHAVTKPLTFVPYETKVLDIAQLLESLGVDPADAPAGGITIIQAGPNPALIASGKITDPVTGFSSTIDFPDPQVQRATNGHDHGGIPCSGGVLTAGGGCSGGLVTTGRVCSGGLWPPVFGCNSRRPEPPATEEDHSPSAAARRQRPSSRMGRRDRINHRQHDRRVFLRRGLQHNRLLALRRDESASSADLRL